MFYPDNVPRAGRLQQLIDSMANMQTDIKHDADEMDKKNTQIRPTIDALLKANGVDNIDDLIAKSIAKLTPEEKKQFEALIAAAKQSKDGFDWTYFAAGLLVLPEGAILTGKLFLAIGRFVLRIQVLQNMASFFRSADGGASAAAAKAAEIEELAAESESEIKEASAVGEGGTEVEEAATLISKVATFFKILGAVGFAITIIVSLIEIVEGSEQKTKLIDAIRSCQPARLTIAFFKREAANITQQLELLVTYLEALSGPDADPEVAAYLGKKIVKNIIAENSTIDFSALETELETQDRTSGNFYGDDDLSHDDVVALAKASPDTKPGVGASAPRVVTQPAPGKGVAAAPHAAPHSGHHATHHAAHHATPYAAYAAAPVKNSQVM